MRCLIALYGGAIFVSLACAPAFAGASADDHDHDENATVFFGVVKDQRGSAVPDAIATISQRNMSFVTRTDVLGGYRFVTTMDADQAELSCRKDGYRQTGTARRSPPGAKSPIEIDCVMQRGAK